MVSFTLSLPCLVWFWQYMKVECAPACYSCEQLSFEARCPIPDKATLEATNIWKAGDMNKMFERIVAEHEHVTVLLKPGMPNPKYDDSPWVITLDDFLSEEECKALIELGAVEGYERSKDVGAKKFDGTYDSHLSEGRTSSNAWCKEACFNHTMTQSVLKKIEALTGVPDPNSEYLQLLQYEEGQFYETHHDYIEFHLNREQGVRIITVFLYLNDVEEGNALCLLFDRSIRSILEVALYVLTHSNCFVCSLLHNRRRDQLSGPWFGEYRYFLIVQMPCSCCC
jgi:prolyl 4-hydroxylase